VEERPKRGERGGGDKKRGKEAKTGKGWNGRASWGTRQYL